MDQLMLLAQLAGEGKKTEAILRSHGFEDVESIVNADLRELAETLEISDKAAIRMVHQAEELMESPPEERQYENSPPRQKSVKPARKPAVEMKAKAKAKAKTMKDPEIDTKLSPETIPAPTANPADIREVKVPDRSRKSQPGVTAAEMSALRPTGSALSALTRKPMATAAEPPSDASKEKDSKEERPEAPSFWYFG